MKTRFFLAALAGVALASCVTDKEYDVSAQNENVKIAFDSPVMYDNDTRAVYHGEVGSHQYTPGGTTYSYPQEEHFVIHAVKHTSDFGGWEGSDPATFNGKTLTYDSSLDGWAPKSGDAYYYWPQGYKLSYAAHSPADLEQGTGWSDNNVTYDKTGLTITGFKVPALAANHFDLMFSERVVNKTAADMNHSASYYSGLPIKFQHALSSIRFSLRNTSEANVVLTKISLYGVYNTGNFAENITEGDDKTKYERGDSGNVKPAWTGQSNAVSKDDAYVAFSGGLQFPTEAKYITDLMINATAGSKNEVLLLLPQDIPDGAKLHVEYTVNGAEASKTVNLKGATKIDPSTNEAIESPTANDKISKWEIGTRYTYRLYYSSESSSQDRIYFAPKSDTWKDAGTAVIELKATDHDD